MLVACSWLRVPSSLFRTLDVTTEWLDRACDRNRGADTSHRRPDRRGRRGALRLDVDQRLGAPAASAQFSASHSARRPVSVISHRSFGVLAIQPRCSNRANSVGNSSRVMSGCSGRLWPMAKGSRRGNTIRQIGRASVSCPGLHRCGWRRRVRQLRRRHLFAVLVCRPGRIRRLGPIPGRKPYRHARGSRCWRWHVVHAPVGQLDIFEGSGSDLRGCEPRT